MLGGIDYRTLAAAVRRALQPVIGTIGTNGSVLTADSTQSAGARWSLPGEASGVGRNIGARTNAVTPNTKFDMSADQLVVKDTNGGALVLNTVGVTVNMGVVGANGIDAGAQASSTWYYGYVIAKPDGTIAGLASTSATAPTMPSGYTYKALVTAVRSNGATQFTSYYQQGNKVRYGAKQSFLAGGTATVETGVSIATVVPPIANSYSVLMQCIAAKSAAAAANNTAAVRIEGGVDYVTLVAETPGASTAYNSAAFEIPNLSNAVSYINAGAGAPDSATTSLWAIGFKLPVGGE